MVLNRPLIANENSHIQDLTERLTHEWKYPGELGEPIIILEQAPAGVPFRVYVVWLEWGDISQIERSRIIMQAAEAAKGRDFTLKITLAMGLTQDEADKLGIDTQ